MMMMMISNIVSIIEDKFHSLIFLFEFLMINLYEYFFFFLQGSNTYINPSQFTNFHINKL